MIRLIVLMTLLTAFGAEAQVVKCKDPSGKTIYSDVACPSNSSGARVNLSGGNLTEEQLRSALDRKADGTKKAQAVAQCAPLMDQAHRTFSAFTENTNRNRWNVSFQALQNLSDLCPTADTCELVKTRVGRAQQRYSQDNTPTRGEQLNSVTSLFAQICAGGISAGGRVARPIRAASPAPTRTHMTKDEFGTMVRSDSCYMVKDAFGTLVRSAGCK